jgi:hypothetical protein
VPAQGQGVLYNCPWCDNSSQTITDDTDVAAVCWYVGSGVAGYVTVSAAGDLLFEVGDTSTADTHIECDASIAADGSRSGTIDVSVAACDTWTEVLNIVNKPESDFRCALVSALGSDTPGPSGTGFILAEADQIANGDGYKIKWDSSAQLSSTITVAPKNKVQKSSFYMPDPRQQSMMLGNPFFAKTPLLISLQELATFTGAGAFNVYSVAGKYTATPRNSAGNIGFTYSETVTTLWSTAGIGATTVVKLFGGCDTPATACDPAWGQQGLLGTNGEKMLVRTGAATTWGTITDSLSAVLLGDHTSVPVP